MTRLFLTSLLALSLAFSLAAQDKPAAKDDKPPELTAAQKQFDELQSEFKKVLSVEFKAAKNDEERAAILRNRLSEIGGSYAEKAVKLAQANPKDPMMMEFLKFAIIVGRNQKAVDLIVTSLQAHPELPDACLQLAGEAPENPAVESLIKTLAEKATDKKLQGAATLALVTQLLARADVAADAKARDAALNAAEAPATALTKEFAQVDGPDEKLGEVGKKMLFQIHHLAIGRPAPEVVSRDLDGKETKLSSYKGKVVVMDIWATWCGPCCAMIPHEREMVEKLKGKPFVFISVSADSKKEDLTKFLEKEKMPWVHWWEGGNENGLLKEWNVQFFPTIYVIDAKGVIRFKHLRGKQLEDAVETLVKEAEMK